MFGDSLAQTADDQGICVFPDLPQGGIAARILARP
jgi:hypothetical protein